MTFRCLPKSIVLEGTKQCDSKKIIVRFWRKIAIKIYLCDVWPVKPNKNVVPDEKIITDRIIR